MEYFLQNLLTNVATPEMGLVILFVCAILAATLLPLGSEPVLLALLAFYPDLLWPSLLIATLGNTLGGVIGWWMGYGAERWMAKHLHQDHVTVHMRALTWLERIGPPACLGAWLPIIGDPLCVVAGYLRLPLVPCVVYMAIGKGLRYLLLIYGWQFLAPFIHA
jgi:membrane protein YqaA with SNARE-associated domain